jgi:hypothetical protein
MNYETLDKLFDELDAKLKAAQKEMQGHARPLIQASADAFFAVCPEIESVHWVQYTPYFNDGETCEFSVHSPCFQLQNDVEFNEYESSSIYTSNDLDSALKNLESALEYEKDPTAWREAYLQRYQKNNGRPYPYAITHLHPMKSVEDAQKEIELIKADIETYTPEAVERIDTKFDDFSRSISRVSDDIMKIVYGDHVLVRITRSGTTVESFSHD